MSAVAAVTAMRGLLRKARDSTGQKLVDVSQDSFEGVPIEYRLPGTVPATAKAIVGDFTKAIVGVRKDLTYKLLDQDVLSDNTGKVIYNLAQHDMVALRVTARFAYATAKPATRVGGSGYPFSVLQDVTP